MKAAFLLALLALTAAAAWWRRRPRAGAPAPPGPLASAPALAAVGAAAVAWLTARGDGPGGPVLTLETDVYAQYRLLLCELPLALQGAVGLALVLLASVLTARLVAARLSRRALAAAGAGVAAWALAYQALPFHLSGPDLDDFFLVDKLLCAVEPGWGNNKPLFTVYDYLFRIADLAGTTGDPFLRYAVGGWLWVLYQANALLAARRLLAGRLAARLGARGAVVAGGLLAANLALVLLSTTVGYELAGAVLLLLSFNVIEGILDGELCARRPGAAVLAWSALALALQLFSHHQLAVLWLAVLAHGALALHELRADRPVTTALVLLASAAVTADKLAPGLENLALEIAKGSPWGLGGLAGGVALAVAALVAARGVLLRWVREPWRRGTTVLAGLGYGALALVLFVAAHPDRPEAVPFSFHYGHWIWAPLHARYSCPFFPFGAAGLAWVATAPRVPRAAGWVALGAAALLWNLPYATGFYRSDPARRVRDGMSAYDLNGRPWRELRARIDGGLSGPWLYLPIPRDHGDHYLVRAVQPRAVVASACEPLPPRGTLVVTRSTAFLALDGFGRGGVLALPFAPARGIEDRGWEVQTADAQRLDPAALARWCEAWRAAIPPAPEQAADGGRPRP